MSNKCLVGAGFETRPYVWLVLGSDAEVCARTEYFEVDDVALPDAHSGPSVESGGACDALGVHAEADPGDTAPVVFGKGVAKEGEPESALAPRAAYAHHVDPSLTGERLAEGNARYLVAVLGQKPEGGIEALRLCHPDETLEGAARPSPHVLEGVLDGLEGRTLVTARDEGADGDFLGPVW